MTSDQLVPHTEAERPGLDLAAIDAAHVWSAGSPMGQKLGNLLPLGGHRRRATDR